MLLTTAVGGLGLTLTGANIVVFLEHDWNPMRDLQAMDRAHRIGQTRTVNVYRLILKDTLEEQIMSLQRFKANLARSLVQNQGDLVDAKGASLSKKLELNDVLASFEEHTAYKAQVDGVTRKPTSSSAARGKAAAAKGAGRLTMGQIIAENNFDREAQELEETWRAVDFEKL